MHKNIKKFTKHLSHYMPLFGILAAGFAGVVLFSYDRSFQIAVIIIVSVAYVVWGIIHHHIHKDLYLIVVLEYLAVAVLGMVLVFSLIFTM